MSALTHKKKFSLIIKDTDKYQRKIVVLTNKHLNINKQMVKTGNAWTYRQYNTDKSYIKLENLAKKEKKGLWQNSKAIAPWEWRQKQKKQ